MDGDGLIKVGLGILILVLPLLITYLTVNGSRWLAAGRDKLLAETKSGMAQNAIARLFHIADTVVVDINNTIKPAIVDALKDKKISKEEAADLKKLALSRLKIILSEQGKVELLEFLGIADDALDVYLGGVVEKAVEAAKVNEAAVTTTQADAANKVAGVGP